MTREEKKEAGSMSREVKWLSKEADSKKKNWTGTATKGGLGVAHVLVCNTAENN